MFLYLLNKIFGTMEKRKQMLLDATERLLKAETNEEEIVKSLVDIGVSEEEAKGLIKEAKKEKGQKKAEGAEQREKKSFWDTSGEKYFKTKEISGAEKVDEGGIFSKILKGEEEGKKVEKAGWVMKKAAPITERKFKKTEFREILPVRVSDFDKLIERGGLKRGDTIMVSGGCGTGKTTFGMQSLYNGALDGNKGVYLTLEESAEKMKENMKHNFGWDLDAMEREGKIAVIKIDPLTIARAVEATLTRERGGLYIEFEEFELPFQFNLPFKPDRVVVDSLSALSIAFMENEQAYRMYLRHLFSTLEKYNSVNFVLGETEQEPGIYSRSGIEEFLADGVVVFYNIKIHNLREKALEILKLRSSNHEKRIVPYKIGPNGIEIYINQELFREE